MDSRQFAAVPPTLREQEAERLRLEQANFNLKMQVFHLEERLQHMMNPADDDEIRVRVDECRCSRESGDKWKCSNARTLCTTVCVDRRLQQENAQQRQLLDELQLELEHKNLCLQKASSLIQAFKKQMEENAV